MFIVILESTMKDNGQEENPPQKSIKDNVTPAVTVVNQVKWSRQQLLAYFVLWHYKQDSGFGNLWDVYIIY